MNKIAIIDTVFNWPPKGGSWVDLYETATELVSLGHEVTFIVPEYEQRGLTAFNHIPFKVEKIPFTGINFSPKNICKLILRKVESIHPDIVMLGDGYFLKSPLLNILSNYKTVLRFFAYELLCITEARMKDGKNCGYDFLSNPDLCYDCWLDQYGKDYNKRKFSNYDVEFMRAFGFLPNYHPRLINNLKECHATICYNELISKIIKSINPNCFVMPGGVNADLFKYKERIPVLNRKKRIFMPGNTHSLRKGYSVFIKAIELLNSKRGDFEVYVNNLQKGKAGNIISLGLFPYHSMYKLYQQMDICVVPSIWDEPFGMVSLEAMATGIPAIVSDVGGLKTTVRDGYNGFIFENGDARQLSQKIEYLLDNEDERILMGKNGREWVEQKFSWKKIVPKNYKKVFDSLGV
ncbi:MAG: glycosyltransferase family 4 protein [Gammaproteobacteria bacterium]|nr:glycosyltransferase family 4 protein [Gammaproteobacteria bacterium]